MITASLTKYWYIAVWTSAVLLNECQFSGVIKRKEGIELDGMLLKSFNSILKIYQKVVWAGCFLEFPIFGFIVCMKMFNLILLILHQQQDFKTY
jgi:hypothetical protein